MFGSYKIKRSRTFSIMGKNIEVAVNGKCITYSGPGGKKSIVTKSKVPTVTIVPSPPRGKYLSFLVIVLDESVIIPARMGVSMWVRAPFGIKVFIDDMLVDYFNTEKIKRCLYNGFIGGDVIAGCVRSKPVISDGKVRGLAGVNFVVKNSSSSPVVVEKVPILTSGSPMFYSKNFAYYPWYKITVFDNYAVLKTNYTSPVENLVSTGNFVFFNPGYEVRLVVNKKEEKIII